MILMVAVALMTAMNVNAQSDELKNELGISYGLGISMIGDGIGNGIGNVRHGIRSLTAVVGGAVNRLKDHLGAVLGLDDGFAAAAHFGARKAAGQSDDSRRRDRNQNGGQV